MDTEARDELLAFHHSRLVDYVLARLAWSVLAGSLVALVIGGFAWQGGSTGWVFAAPGVGLVAFSVVMLWGSAPDVWRPPED